MYLDHTVADVVGYLPGDSLHLLYAIAVQHGIDPHSHIRWHTASLSARDKQEILVDALVQKTVTVRLADHLVLCTGVGDVILTRAQRHAIATALGLPQRATRHCSINPPDCSPEDAFEMRRGMVSPFLRPGGTYPVSAVVVLPWPIGWEDEERNVAVSLSLHHSLLLPLRRLRAMLRLYARQAYPQIRWIELATETSHAQATVR